jgi:hypothetical protein
VQAGKEDELPEKVTINIARSRQKDNSIVMLRDSLLALLTGKDKPFSLITPPPKPAAEATAAAEGAAAAGEQGKAAAAAAAAEGEGVAGGQAKGAAAEGGAVAEEQVEAAAPQGKGESGDGQQSAAETEAVGGEGLGLTETACTVPMVSAAAAAGAEYEGLEAEAGSLQGPTSPTELGKARGGVAGMAAKSTEAAAAATVAGGSKGQSSGSSSRNSTSRLEADRKDLAAWLMQVSSDLHVAWGTEVRGHPLCSGYNVRT